MRFIFVGHCIGCNYQMWSLSAELCKS